MPLPATPQNHFPNSTESPLPAKMTRHHQQNGSHNRGRNSNPARKRQAGDDESMDATPEGKKLATESQRPSQFQPEMSHYKFSDLGGCESQLLEMCRFAIHLNYPDIHTKMGIKPPKGFLLHGPPGCGKTTFAKALAGELEMPLYAVSSTQLIAGLSGESEKRIRELFSEVVKNAPAVLLFDDIDIIAAKRENAQREMERRIVTQLIASIDDLDDARVIVIGTTNRPEVLDASLRRAGRFDKEIALGIPDERTRECILRIATRDMRIKEDVSIPQLAHFTPGYVGADLHSLVREASLSAVNRVFETTVSYSANIESTLGRLSIEGVSQELSKVLAWLKSKEKLDASKLEGLYVEQADFIRALSTVHPSAKREGFATVPDVRWDDIGALADVRAELEWNILNPVRKPDDYAIFSAGTRPQGILLCGPPGCGKTLLAKAVANETGINFISIKGPELLSMYVGESERAVRTLFQRARDSSPCVIFFDEIDALCPRRSNNEGSGSSRLVNQLLTEMDGMEARKQVYLIGATNRPDIIDVAILRPGRLDKILFVDFPNADDRADILRKATKGGTSPLICKSVDFEAIASNPALELFTGADLIALIHEASIIALKERIEKKSSVDRLTMEHFELAMKRILPSVPPVEREKYRTMKKRYCKEPPATTTNQEEDAGEKMVIQ